MATVASFNVALIASSGRFIGAISQADRRWMQFARNIQRETRRMPESMRQVTNASLTMARTVAKTFAVVGAVASGAGAWGIRLAAQYEQTQIAFATMLGSMQEADRFLRFLEERARRTPFGFVQLQELARSLLAWGFARREIERMIDPIGNFVAAMGGGSEHMERIVRALGQIRARGKLASQEMLQLTEVGVPAWAYLAEQLGVTVPRAMEMTTRGMIDAEAAVQAILRGLAEDPRFVGAMERQANTILGRWEQVKDGLTTITRGLGQDIIRITGLGGALERLAQSVGRVADAVSSSGGLLAAFRESFPPWLPAAIFAIAGAIGGSLVPVIVAALIPALRRLRAAIAVTGMSLRTWMIAGAAIVTLAYLIYRNWGDLPGFVRRVWAGITAPVLLFASLVVRGLAVVQSAIAVLLPFTRSAAEQLHGWADSLRAAAASAWGVATSASGLTDAAKGAEDLGQTGDEAAKSQLGLGDALEQAAKAARQNLQSFDEVHTLQEEMAGGPAGLELALDLGGLTVPPAVGGIGETFGDIADKVGESAGRLASAWQSAVQSISTWWANLRARAIDTFPWLDGVVRAAGRAIDWLREQTGGLGPVIENTAGLISLLLVPTLLGMGLAALKAAGKVVLGWTMQGIGAIRSVAVALWAAGVKVATWAWLAAKVLFYAARTALGWIIAMGPIAWVTAAVVAVATLVILYWDEIRAWTIQTWTTVSAWVRQTWENLKAWAAEVFGGIWQAIVDRWEGIKARTSEIWGAIITWIQQQWDGIKQSASNTWSGIVATIQGWWDNLWGRAQTFWNDIKTGFVETWQGVKDTASSIWRGISNTVIGWVNHIIEAINGMIRSLNKLRIEIPKVNIPGIGEIGGGVIGFNIPLIPKIPLLARGGDITGSGLAVVGEAGPELLSLPRGASVTPLSGGGTVEDAVYRAVYAAIRDAARVERLQGGPSQDTQVVLEIDGQRIARAIIPPLAREQQRTGFRLIPREA